MIIIIECFLHIKNPVLNILYVVSDCLFFRQQSCYLPSHMPLCPFTVYCKSPTNCQCLLAFPLNLERFIMAQTNSWEEAMLCRFPSLVHISSCLAWKSCALDYQNNVVVSILICGFFKNLFKIQLKWDPYVIGYMHF